MHITKQRFIQQCPVLLLFIIGEHLHEPLWVLGAAWKMPVSLTTRHGQSQQQGAVELLEAGAETVEEAMGGLVFLPLQSHCYVVYLWLRYCNTSSHFNGTTRSHKSQAGLATLFLVAPSSGPQAPLQTSTFSSEPGPSFCSRQVH